MKIAMEEECIADGNCLQSWHKNSNSRQILSSTVVPNDMDRDLMSEWDDYEHEAMIWQH